MKKLLFLFVIVLLIQSCVEETTPELTSFPTNIGTEWIYEEENIIKWYDSEISDTITNIDTIILNYSLLISKDTILRDSIFVKEFVTNEIGTQSPSKQYFKLDNDGLKEIACKLGGPIVFAKNKKKSYKVPNSAILFGFEPLLYNGNPSDNLFFYNKPRLSIKLPLSINDKWIFTDTSDLIVNKIEKECIGYENVKTYAGTFNCFKIKYKFYNSTIFDGIEWIDWISNKGLIKRQVINPKITLMSAEGDILGYGQVTSALMIKHLKIVN